MKIKNRFYPLLLLVSLAVCAHAEQAGEFHLAGNISDLTPGGELRISASGGGLGVVEDLSVSQFSDGEIDISLVPGEAQVVWIAVYNSEEKFVGKTRLVLEPGSFVIEMAGKKLKARGNGPLNTALFYSWQDDVEYKKAREAGLSLYKRMLELPKEDQKLYYEARIKPKLDAAEKIKQAALKTMALDDSKPVLARLAVMERGLDSNEEAIARLEELESVLGPSAAVDNFRARIAAAEAAEHISRDFGVGEKARDFTIPTLDGEELTLSDVIADNELVLLEFWAVWCAPCRAEIPHMKRAYAEYSDKGFEIVSVSLDDNREDWETLSREENIPWFNTSDLLFYASPVIQDYGVLGIPKNYLVNSDMFIIAEDLRQEELDKALEEYLGSH